MEIGKWNAKKIFYINSWWQLLALCILMLLRELCHLFIGVSWQYIQIIVTKADCFVDVLD